MPVYMKYLIIQSNRLQGGPRRVTHITEVAGMEGDTVLLQPIFTFERQGIDAEGKIAGLCAMSGAIANMWSSTLTMYFAMMQAEAQGVKIGFLIGG
jgi:hypothetical protein